MVSPSQFKTVQTPEHVPRREEQVSAETPEARMLRPQPIALSTLESLPKLAANEVHVCELCLAQSPLVLDSCEAVLSSDERERAARFHFETHRTRFIAGRGQLRLLLGHYLQVEPAGLQFRYGPNGKPGLAGPAKPGCELHFNLAHSEELALLAITRLCPLGVDVERIRALADFEELVARFFSVREATAFARLSPVEQPKAFFNLWTRKEAWLKALGKGIPHGLDKVEVSFLPGEEARLLTLPEPERPESWALRELHPADGFAAALALQMPEFELNTFGFEMAT